MPKPRSKSPEDKILEIMVAADARKDTLKAVGSGTESQYCGE